MFLILKVLYTVYAMSTTGKELAYPSTADRLASVSTQPKKKTKKRNFVFLKTQFSFHFALDFTL